MRRSVLVAVALAAVAPASAAEWRPDLQMDVRRVSISTGFGGQSVFLYGHVPPDISQLVTVVEAPAEAPHGVVEYGRLGPIWLGVRRHRIEGLPELYLVLIHDPARNVLRTGGPALDIETLDRRLEAAGGTPVSPAALLARAKISEPGATARVGDSVLEAFWELQSSRGLYGVRTNAIRIDPKGLFYAWLVLPAVAPEGRYGITTYYLRSDGRLTTERSTLLVRTTGLVAQVTRVASRSPALYGITVVVIAVGAGWLAGAMRRSRPGL